MTRTTRARVFKGAVRWFAFDHHGCYVGAYTTWPAAMYAATHEQ